MKNLVAVLLCLIMILSLFSCESNEDQNELPSNENAGSSDVIEAESAIKMYEAAINDEICVFDERLGETSLKSLRFTSDGARLDECKLLTSAILDLNEDGINEYVIKSPDYECIVLRYYDGKVYSYCLSDSDFYNFNTDGSFYWYESDEQDGWECGLSKAVFDGGTLNIKSIYSLKYSKNPAKYEYFVDGKATARDEYDACRYNNMRKEKVKFSQFELSCPYPVNAEQAWNLANEYWDDQDGCKDTAAGTVYTARIVLTDTPNSETDYYRFAFNIESISNGGGEGDECKPPHHVRTCDQILVNAFTGEIRAATYQSGGKVVSVEEAIEIVKNDFFVEDIHNEDGYHFEYAVNEEAPDHIYAIVIQKAVDHQFVFYTREWVDKYTGEIVNQYYMYGKG